MLMLKISGEKLKKLRGARSLDTISKASGKAFSDVALMKWEKGINQPTEESIRLLLKVYECELKDITEKSEWESV